MKSFFQNIFVILTILYCHAWSKRNENISDDGTKQSKNDVIVVETDLGRIAGKKSGHVNSFLGIPFAQPPINALRFHHQNFLCGPAPTALPSFGHLVHSCHKVHQQ